MLGFPYPWCFFNLLLRYAAEAAFVHNFAAFSIAAAGRKTVFYPERNNSFEKSKGYDTIILLSDQVKLHVTTFSRRNRYEVEACFLVDLAAGCRLYLGLQLTDRGGRTV